MIPRGLTSETFASETIRQVLHAHVVTDRRRASIKFRKLVPLSWLQVLNWCLIFTFPSVPFIFLLQFFLLPPRSCHSCFSLNFVLAPGQELFLIPFALFREPYDNSSLVLELSNPRSLTRHTRCTPWRLISPFGPFRIYYERIYGYSRGYG